ncbi:MAG TPA: high-potential iron-sulfur protein [Pirellulales bacterium]|nr:high-potential iron-sulfur protein [Pirellulales bacterium]
MHRIRLNRRVFLHNAAIAFPIGYVVIEQVALAQDDLPHVTSDDPTAKALYYVEDATKVDKSNPLAVRYTEGQHCGNCLNLQGDAGAAWRPCNLFPGKLVSSKGWCSLWTKIPDA